MCAVADNSFIILVIVFSLGKLESAACFLLLIFAQSNKMNFVLFTGLLGLDISLPEHLWKPSEHTGETYPVKQSR